MATSNKNIIKAYLELLKLLECPICYEYGSSVSGTYNRLCTEGHFVCGNCGPRRNECPVCRNPFSSVRPRILDQIIETVIYPCSKVDCGTMVLREFLRNHEEECQNSEENAESQKDAVLTQNILKHIEENFSSFFVRNPEYSEMDLLEFFEKVEQFSIESREARSSYRYEYDVEERKTKQKSKNRKNRDTACETTTGYEAVGGLERESLLNSSQQNEKKTMDKAVQCDLYGSSSRNFNTDTTDNRADFFQQFGNSSGHHY